MKTKTRSPLISGSVAIVLAAGMLMLKAQCPGIPTPGGGCTTSQAASNSDGCIKTACDQDSTITGSCAEADTGSCSTYTIEWTCNMTQYPKLSNGNCNPSGIGAAADPPTKNGLCTLTSTSCN